MKKTLLLGVLIAAGLCFSGMQAKWEKIYQGPYMHLLAVGDRDKVSGLDRAWAILKKKEAGKVKAVLAEWNAKKGLFEQRVILPREDVFYKLTVVNGVPFVLFPRTMTKESRVRYDKAQEKMADIIRNKLSDIIKVGKAPKEALTEYNNIFRNKKRFIDRAADSLMSVRVSKDFDLRSMHKEVLDSIQSKLIDIDKKIKPDYENKIKKFVNDKWVIVKTLKGNALVESMAASNQRDFTFLLAASKNIAGKSIQHLIFKRLGGAVMGAPIVNATGSFKLSAGRDGSFFYRMSGYLKGKEIESELFKWNGSSWNKIGLGIEFDDFSVEDSNHVWIVSGKDLYLWNGNKLNKLARFPVKDFTLDDLKVFASQDIVWVKGDINVDDDLQDVIYKWIPDKK